MLKGTLLVNNLLEITPGKSYPVITSINQSLPVLCGTEKTKSPDQSILPGYSTVIRLENLDTGLQHISHISPQFKDSYFLQPSSQYTFEVIESPRDNIVGLRIDQSAHRAINDVSNELLSSRAKSIFVAGTSFSGKLTISKTLIDFLVMKNTSQVVLLDLDPNSTKFSPPCCISLSVHSEASIGNFIKSSRSDDEICYFGFSIPNASPTNYFRWVEHLRKTYLAKWKHLPLIINSPPGIKGYAREVLIKLTQTFSDLDPALVYLSHNDAVEVGEFDVEEFETQDNPDDEVIADLSFHTVHRVHATRRKPKYLGPLAHELDTIQYFHRISPLQWDLTTFLVESAPVVIPFSPKEPTSVPVVASLHETITELTLESLQEYIEATVVALCWTDIPKRLLQDKKRPHFINTEEFIRCKARFICLCAIHSIHIKEGHYLAYLPRDQSSMERLRKYSQGTLAFVRSENLLPTSELLSPRFLNKSIPYVTPAPISKVGGVWNARRNLGRKGQK